MKVESSKYLRKSKPLLKELVKKLSEKFTFVSVLATDCNGKTYRVTKKTVDLGPSYDNERGFVVKVYNGKNYYEYSFNNLDKENLQSIITKIADGAVEFFNMKGFTLSSYEGVKEEKIEKVFNEQVEINPEEESDNVILKSLIDIKDKCSTYSEKIVQVAINYEFLHVNKMYLSTNKDLEQSYMWSNGVVNVITADNDNNQYSYRGFSGFKGLEIIDEMKNTYKEVADTAIELLSAKPVPPGFYDVICTEDISGLIAHEAFGHGVEMDMFVKNRAKSKEYFGKYIASPLVTMHDGAKGVREISSYFFDDEGTMAQDTVVINKGILEKGMCDSLSALALGQAPTGNGKRESFERKAYARMTNTYFEPGNDTLEDMIKSIDYGFLLDQEASGMEDPKNWGIQCILGIAREIKDGKLTGKIFSPVVLTGYVPDLLKSISMVSKDVKLYGTGYCGKGYKEWVKVSAGGPCIKAKVRLG